jgi:hypothetical protein
VVRIESGHVGISTTDLLALLRVCGVRDEGVVATFIADARKGRAATGWRRYADVLTSEYMAFLGYESSATRIRQFHSTVVPGLLQIEPYGRAIIAATCGLDRVDRFWEARAERQRLLERADAPMVHVVLDEAVLRRRIGGSQVMGAQIARLQDLVARDKVRLQIIPFTAGAHPGLSGPFVLLDVADESVVYLEGVGNTLVTQDRSAEAARYPSLFDRIERSASPADETRKLLVEVADAFSHDD